MFNLQYTTNLGLSAEIIITHTRRKTIVLSILSSNRIEVKAPNFISDREIYRLLEKKKDWIQNHLQTQKNSSVHTYQSGDKFLYLGNYYTLDINNYPTIAIVNNVLTFPSILQFRIKKELEIWFVRQAKIMITKRVQWYAKQMKLSYKEISFGDTKSRWGSCSFDNRLKFNWKLIFAPLAVIDYVAVHELVHTTEKNHTWLFWSKVRFVLPAYKQRRLWLKKHGEQLTL